MQYRKLGNSAIMVSAIGLGTWAVGGDGWWGPSDESQCIKAVHAALAGGVNLIDTAPVYGFGYSEELVGKAIAGRRNQIILSSKTGLWWDDDTGNYFYSLDGIDVHKCLKPKNMAIELERSLKRLNTDYIDIYHTHWQDKTTPIDETAEFLNKALKEGKIRAIAVSNATTKHMEQYFKTCTIVANQPKYSILERKIEPELVDYCVEKNVGILAYSPLELGLLTGKVTMETVFSEHDTRTADPWFQLENRARVIAFLDSLKGYTEKYNCTIAQLMIAWTFSQKGITSVLCGARKEANAMENVAAGSLIIDEEDLAAIRFLAPTLSL